MHSVSKRLKYCRAYCTKMREGAVVSSEEELVIWIPGKMLCCALRDPDLRQFVTESVLRSGLLPAKLAPESAARQWAAIYMSSEPEASLYTHCLAS